MSASGAHVAVWLGKPIAEHVRSQAERRCACWERKPGADDALPGALRARRVDGFERGALGVPSARGRSFC
jgi:hypothetical protein